jgi:hypothetical protein
VSFMILIQSSSLVGGFLLLFAFAGVSFDFINKEKYVYNFMNLFGASLLTMSAILSINWGFMILNGFWTCMSVISIIKILKKRYFLNLM